MDLNWGGSTIGWTQTDVLDAFVQVQNCIEWTAIETVVRALGIFLVLCHVISSMQESLHAANGLDTREIAKHLFTGFFVITLLSTFNYIIMGINGQFAAMEEKLSTNQTLTQRPGEMFMEMADEFYSRLEASETDEMAEELDSGDSSSSDDTGFVSGITDVWHSIKNVPQYIEEALLKVALYPFIWIADFIYNNIYLMYLCGRYIYLLLLELVSPIAIICIIHPQTRQMFITWTKNLFICHLLLPAFYLANYFSDLLGVKAGTWYANLRVSANSSDGISGAVSTTASIFGGTFTMDAVYLLAAIVFMLIIKISMLNTVKNKIHNLI